MGNVHREWVLGKHDRVSSKLSGWLLLVQVPAGPLGSHLGHKGAMLGIKGGSSDRGGDRWPVCALL